MIYNLEAGLLQAVGMFEHGLSMGLMSAIYNIGSVVLQSSIKSVCVCEPATWVVCCGFILAALYLFRNDFRDDNIKETV